MPWRTRHQAQRLVPPRSAEESTKPEGSPGMSSEDARYILDTFNQSNQINQQVHPWSSSTINQQDTLTSKLCKPPCHSALKASALILLKCGNTSQTPSNYIDLLSISTLGLFLSVQFHRFCVCSCFFPCYISYIMLSTFHP